MNSFGGMFCPEATIINYLQAKCPLVWGNLWDVTDRDIDRLSAKLFERMGLWDGIDKLDVGAALSLARDACLLKWLNGAAPVIYGVPPDIRK